MMRTLILTHRSVGIATCLLFVMWFGSGVVMMYVGFPQLTAVERFWNWCGAVLHWLYFTELRKAPELWRQVVLWVSGICIVSAVTGIVVGIVRWRPRKRYRNGTTSLYSGMMRWHHVLGLAAAVPLLTWIVSGWLSVNPGRYLSDRGLDRVSRERYAGLDHPVALFTTSTEVAWRTAQLSPPAKEVLLRYWEGRPLYVFASSPEHISLIAGDASPSPAMIGGTAAVTKAAHRLLPEARMVHTEVLQSYDFYWYEHHDPRPLPVLRVVFDDPQARWFHPDPASGDVLEHLDASRRVQRILFNALHSLNSPVLLAYRPAWDIVVLALSMLGMALSVTAVVIAWFWVRG